MMLRNIRYRALGRTGSWILLALWTILITPTHLVAVQPAPPQRRIPPFQLSTRHGVTMEAHQVGISPGLAVCIVEHESRFRVDALGDGHLTCRRTGKPMRSRGLWQINDCFHPEVSDEVAFSAPGSTEWALARIKSGRAGEWSTYERCSALLSE